MKKFTAIILCFLLCFTLASCSAAEERTETGAVSQGSVSHPAADNVSTEETAQSSEEESTSEKAPPQEAESHGAEKQSSTAAAETTAKKENKTEKTATTAKAQQSVDCTVTIEYTKLLEHLDRLDEAHREIVNESGLILTQTSVTVREGESVYDALRKVCSENGVYINAKSTGYGIYIAGFNGIDEKDCGSSSGWLYSVNGSFPGKACDKMILEDGDRVVFSYTC